MAYLEVLLEHRSTQIQDLQQRDSLLRERGDAQQHSQTLHQELQELRLKADQERVAQEIYVRGVEDRAHREVDRAREESKCMTAQVKEAGNQLEHLQQRLEGAQAALGQALQNAAAPQSIRLPEWHACVVAALLRDAEANALVMMVAKRDLKLRVIIFCVDWIGNAALGVTLMHGP